MTFLEIEKFDVTGNESLVILNPKLLHVDYPDQDLL
jgi:hypothetical protein